MIDFTKLQGMQSIAQPLQQLAQPVQQPVQQQQQLAQLIQAPSVPPTQQLAIPQQPAYAPVVQQPVQQPMATQQAMVQPAVTPQQAPAQAQIAGGGVSPAGGGAGEGQIDWTDFGTLKNIYGGNWYDFGAQYGIPGWMRAPRINPAGAEAVWNEQYGWQDWDDVQAGGQLTPNFGDVYKLFGGYNTASPLPGGAPAGTEGWPGYPGDGGAGGAGGDGYQPPAGGETPYYGESLGVQYPAPWNTAQDVLTQFAEGMPTDVPPEWETMLGQLSDVWNQQGMPTSTMPAYTAAKEAAQYDVKSAIDQAMEGYGLMGLRQSTPAIAGAQRIAGEMSSQLGAGFARDETGALEAARGRQMSTLPQMFGAGAGIAGLEESAKDRALGATGQLYNLGQGQWQMPSALGQQAYNMGTGLYGQGQQGIGNMMNEWLRTQMYNNPYLQQALGLGGQTGQYVPQQYSPGGLLGMGIC